ncbi:DUF1499 domain-containing protein [Ancylobacter mangrovi]|uniref:DUF1499 domain-containing protein n=1 Tax=Ancylobacter mangrovi TaxID=2972472 RepID=UPI002163452C|nr:DUF1499 domain-containing protein [Ancylobacter mangrovi]MCS0502232.1 DUF1499 domain-containing protein [Ancylobacter mangrovi]
MIRRRLYVEERVSRLAVWSLRTAVFALPVTLIGLALYLVEALDFRSAAYTVMAGVAVAALALLMALAGFVVIWNEGLRGLGRVLGAAALALVLITPVAALAAFSVGLPVMHDITTDTEDPPQFVTLAMARGRNTNPLAYAGDSAADEQRIAYPGIKPIEFDGLPDDIYTALMRLVAHHKWLVIDAVPPRGGIRDGRIEAVARSMPFGLRDDIVIRIRPTANGTRVDMRSLSRNSDRDFGSNARRIDTLFSELSEAQGRPRR